LVLETSGVPGKAGITPAFNRVDPERQKCERCWHWEMDVGSNAKHPTICGRCVEAVKQFSLK
jgi:isoleucyl-tRNA synthetase